MLIVSMMGGKEVTSPHMEDNTIQTFTDETAAHVTCETKGNLILNDVTRLNWRQVRHVT